LVAFRVYSSLFSSHYCSVLECNRNYRAMMPYLQVYADEPDWVKWVVIILKI
jgi:hypothetical protein